MICHKSAAQVWHRVQHWVPQVMMTEYMMAKRIMYQDKYVATVHVNKLIADWVPHLPLLWKILKALMLCFVLVQPLQFCISQLMY